MSLINASASFFYGNLQVAQLQQKSVADSLQWFIDTYEPEFLQYLLGLQLYEAFIAGIEEDPIDSKWLFLRDGGNFTGWNGYPKKWVGLNSPIAAYVYYHYMRDLQTQTMGVGETRAASQNAIMASASEKICVAWNKMSEQVKILYEYLDINNTDVYPEWTYGSQTNRCRGYFEKINIFGI
jgi:hypothetical protein